MTDGTTDYNASRYRISVFYDLAKVAVNRLAFSQGGRAIAALASDPGRARWNQQSVSSAQLAHEYGFTDIDGSQPDSWALIE